MLQHLEKKNVTMLPGLFRERMLVNRNYLLELGTQELLQNYYLEAGIVMPDLQVLERPETAKLHWGWEAPTCQLRGHFLGHWLSAASSLIASENDAALKAKLDEIISELARCQELNGGEWIGPFPEKYFTRLEKELDIWSPQYVMHKLIMGLTHAYLYAGNEQALTIVWLTGISVGPKRYSPPTRTLSTAVRNPVCWKCGHSFLKPRRIRFMKHWLPVTAIRAFSIICQRERML